MGIGINGMGRIGRLSLRAALGGLQRCAGDPRGNNRLNIVHVNEVKGGAAATTHLLEFDSIHGRWHGSFGIEDDTAIVVNNNRMGFSGAATPGDVAWGDLGCDIVLECTGKFLKPEQLEPYFDRGVRRVIVAAPVKDERALNIVVGVNDRLYAPSRHRLLTAVDRAAKVFVGPGLGGLHQAQCVFGCEFVLKSGQAPAGPIVSVDI